MIVPHILGATNKATVMAKKNRYKIVEPIIRLHSELVINNSELHIKKLPIPRSKKFAASIISGAIEKDSRGSAAKNDPL